MSEMYMDSEALKELNEREDVTMSKAHKARSCAVCQSPIDDGLAVPLRIGEGMEVLIHRGCVSEIMEALTPKPTTIPVSPSVRKSTIATPYSYDEKRLAENIHMEMYALLLEHGMKQ